MSERTEPPIKIWLQYYGEVDEEDVEIEGEEAAWCATWCADQIYTDDVAYVRLDLVREYLPEGVTL